MTTETTTERLAEACRELLFIVRLQNGNLHDDTNEIQARAQAALAAHEAQPSIEHEAIEALRGLASYLTTNQDLLDGAAMNEGRAHGFDVASANARAVLAKAERKG